MQQYNEASQVVNMSGFDVDVDVEFEAHEQDGAIVIDSVVTITPHIDLDRQIYPQCSDIPEKIRKYVCGLIVKDIESRLEKHAVGIDRNTLIESID